MKKIMESSGKLIKLFLIRCKEKFSKKERRREKNFLDSSMKKRKTIVNNLCEILALNRICLSLFMSIFEFAIEGS